MVLVPLADKERIYRFLSENPGCNIYEMGDLDPFYWPYTSWYGWVVNGEMTGIALIYRGTELPVLLFQHKPAGSARIDEFIHALLPELPDTIYAHLPVQGQEGFSRKYRMSSHGKHWKMMLTSPGMLNAIDGQKIRRIGEDEATILHEFYRNAYPGNWFDERMLKTGMFFGLELMDRLVSVAGIHVYSPQYQVAAIGSIATLPEFRGQGLGKKVTAHLCRELLKHVRVIGLNVLQNNSPAIACYRQLGFEIIAEYEEFMMEPINGS